MNYVATRWKYSTQITPDTQRYSRWGPAIALNEITFQKKMRWAPYAFVEDEKYATVGVHTIFFPRLIAF